MDVLITATEKHGDTVVFDLVSPEPLVCQCGLTLSKVEIDEGPLARAEVGDSFSGRFDDNGDLLVAVHDEGQ